MELPLSTRQRIASEFGIVKRNSTHVVNNVIESDGYLIKEVEQALNLKALQEKFNSQETNMLVLWEWLVNGKPEIKLETKVIKKHGKNK